MQGKRTVWLLTALVVVLAAALIGVFVFLNNQPLQTRGPQSVSYTHLTLPTSDLV